MALQQWRLVSSLAGGSLLTSFSLPFYILFTNNTSDKVDGSSVFLLSIFSKRNIDIQNNKMHFEKVGVGSVSHLAD